MKYIIESFIIPYRHIAADRLLRILQQPVRSGQQSKTKVKDFVHHVNRK
ncbi:hypothetical protein [Paenibacillus prosopidis]|nr:hypothetical protein [Paenibacillus prosopidis]